MGKGVRNKNIRRIAAQPGPQSRLLSCPCDDIGYGGARGGGKTFGVLLDFVKHQDKYGEEAIGILFRKSYPELEDVIKKSKILYIGAGAYYNETKKIWTFPNGATPTFRALLDYTE